MPENTLARLVSVVGHPLIMMPAAVLAKMAVLETPMRGVGLTMAIILMICGSIFAFARHQVSRRRWVDTDASQPAERRSLTITTAVALMAVTLALWISDMPSALAAGTGAAAIILLSAIMLSRWCKLSLHVSFAVFAAMLFWPHPIIVLAGLGFAALVGWSRLKLSRHGPIDVMAGSAVGLCAGFAVLIAERVFLSA